MAIAVEGTWTSTAIDETAVTTSTISVTIPSISNGCLVLLVGVVDNTGTIGVHNSPAPTFNTSEVFTKVRSDESASGGSEPRTEIWYLLNPTATTANVVVTYDPSGASTAQNCACVSLVLLSGVSQASPVDAQNGASDTIGEDPETLDITTVADGAMITAVQTWKIPSTIVSTAGSGQTDIYTKTIDQAGATDDICYISAYELKASAGTETVSFDPSAGGDDVVTTAVSWTPSGVAAPSAKRLMTMFIG